MNILVIAPHRDDEILGVGGTIDGKGTGHHRRYGKQDEKAAKTLQIILHFFSPLLLPTAYPSWHSTSEAMPGSHQRPCPNREGL